MYGPVQPRASGLWFPRFEAEESQFLLSEMRHSTIMALLTGSFQRYFALRRSALDVSTRSRAHSKFYELYINRKPV